MEDSKDTLSASDVSNPIACVLPLDNFSNWIHCICVVTFDLELGQSMQLIYPPHIVLSDKEKLNICYLAFPDSNSGCMGDSYFHFRIRHTCHCRKQVVENFNDFNNEAATTLQADMSYFYGFAFFRQKKDKTISRGYFQKSVVIITKFPFINLYFYLLKLISPQFFEHDIVGLETACHDIDNWPPPFPGQSFNLPILGCVLQIRIPCKTDHSQAVQSSLAVKTSPFNTILRSINELNLFKWLKPIISHVQLLWELILTNEPLVVICSSPSECSSVVQSLISLIWPLNYSTDFRPFFTIHDSEFREYTTRTQAPPGVILGVTNPFFCKTLQHWPHVIRIANSFATDSPVTPKETKKNKDRDNNNLFSELKIGERIRGKPNQFKMFESKSGLFTRYKPFLSKDKSLAALLKANQTRPAEAQTCILRRFFSELTESFMIPLERYIGSLMPLQKKFDLFRSKLSMRPFVVEDFIKTLDSIGPQLTSHVKGDWELLYRNFLKSQNFKTWYMSRMHEIDLKLEEIHLQAFMDMQVEDFHRWAKTRNEIEILDFVLKMRSKCSNSAKKVDVNKKLELVVSALPQDIQKLLL